MYLFILSLPFIDMVGIPDLDKEIVNFSSVLILVTGHAILVIFFLIGLGF